MRIINNFSVRVYFGNYFLIYDIEKISENKYKVKIYSVHGTEWIFKKPLFVKEETLSKEELAKFIEYVKKFKSTKFYDDKNERIHPSQILL